MKVVSFALKPPSIPTKGEEIKPLKSRAGAVLSLKRKVKIMPEINPDNTDYLVEAAQNGLTRTDGFPKAYFPEPVVEPADSSALDDFFNALEEQNKAGSPDDSE